MVHLITGVINHRYFKMAMKHKAIKVFTFKYLFSMTEGGKIVMK